MKNKTIIWISIGSALLIGGAVFLYFKNRPKKDEKSKTEKEKLESDNDKSSNDKSSNDKSSNDKSAADKSVADKAAADKAAADKLAADKSAASDKAASDKAASDKAVASTDTQPSGFPLKKAIGFNQLAKNLQKGLNKKCNSKLVEDGKFGALTEAALVKCYGVSQADFALYNKIIS